MGISFSFEIVVGDDCSTDKTFDIINYYANKHPKIFNVKQNSSQLGILGNFKATLDRCEGDFIFNFDGAFIYGGDGLGSVMIDGVSYEGAGITSKAFEQYIPYSDLFLTVAVFLFAISTMISWSYYGYQAWSFLFGRSKRTE